MAVLNRVRRNAVAREAFIFLAFCFFTALVTWPYVTCLRDAVADPGDPYLVSWILWWDYHQTFIDPLNLFHSNLFYPLRYTLAFSEHCYGIALLFFPLFALGAQPLTVNSGALTRAQILLAVVNHHEFAAKEKNRSLVLLHYFGYLHRNPDEPPDRNMDGFNFWLKEVETSGEVDRLTRAFMASIEHRKKTKK